MTALKLAEAKAISMKDKLPFKAPQDFYDNYHIKGDILAYKTVWRYDENEKKKVRVFECKCSACGSVSYLERKQFTGCHNNGYAGGFYYFEDPITKDMVKHCSATVCPACCQGVTVVQLSKISHSFMCFADEDFITLSNIDGCFCLSLWHARKVVTFSGEVRQLFNLRDNYLVVDKFLFRFSGCAVFYNSYTFYSELHYTKKFIDNIGFVDSLFIYNYDPDIIHKSNIEKSGFAEYIELKNRLALVQYLKLWLIYPQIENIVKCGCGKYLNEVLYYHAGIDTDRKLVQFFEHFNKFKVKPHEMLGVSKDDLWIFKKYKFKVCEFYLRYRNSYKFTQRVLDILNVISLNGFGDVMDYQNLFKGINEPINYICRQYERYPDKKYVISFLTLKDYWGYLSDLYSDNEVRKRLAFPKNLIFSHNDMMTRCVEKKELVLSKKIKKLAKERAKYSYTSNKLGLCIRACFNQFELINEGAVLNHCVARYSKAVARAETSIYFIRRVEAPDVPFYTLEYRNGRIIQDHGYDNALQTAEVIQFEKEWLEYIKTIKEKEKNVRRNNSSRSISVAGA